MTPINTSDSTSIHVLAENIIALIIQPENSPYDGTSFTATTSAPTYSYNSQDASNAQTLNQLPPMVEITVVALDEASALRLQAQSANPSAPPNFGLASLFQNATAYQTDLQTLETTLTSQHLTYGVFSEVVTIPQAKWSP